MHDAPLCVTVKVLPPMVSTPVREDDAVLAATEKPTDPLPEPDAPDVTVSQLALLEAVHEHPDEAVTVTVPEPAAAVKFCDVAPMVMMQGAPACVTVNVFPPTVMVPERELLPVFADAVKLAVPAPLPVAPAVMEIQPLPVLALQAQPVPAVTVISPEPPAAGTD